MAKIFTVNDYTLTLADKINNVNSALGVVYKAFDRNNNHFLMHASKILPTDAMLANFFLVEEKINVNYYLI